MGWKRIDDDIVKWSEGMTVVGTLLEPTRNDVGPLLMLSTERGVQTFAYPTVLLKKLSKVEVGTLVRITCRGKLRGKGGKDYWGFIVDEAQADELVPEQLAAPVHTEDSDIPF